MELIAQHHKSKLLQILNDLNNMKTALNRQQRIFWRKNQNLIMISFLTGIILALIGGIVISQEQRLTENNKYNCAVQGFEADCKTPLSAERMLK